MHINVAAKLTISEWEFVVALIEDYIYDESDSGSEQMAQNLAQARELISKIKTQIKRLDK